MNLRYPRGYARSYANRRPTTEANVGTAVPPQKALAHAVLTSVDVGEERRQANWLTSTSRDVIQLNYNTTVIASPIPGCLRL
jgi:hypothetical protein